MEYSSALHAARRKRVQNKFEKDQLDYEEAKKEF